MVRKILALAVAGLMLIALLAACNGGDSASTPTPASGGNSSSSGGDSSTSGGDSASTEDNGRWPSYINLGTGDDYYPIVKEGQGGDVVLTMAISQPSNGGKWEDLWIGKFADRYMNINFEVEQILQTAVDERMALMFASGDLPDILMNFKGGEIASGLNTANIVRYGQIENQLLDMTPYIDPELTPDLHYLFDKRPDARGNSTAMDGAIYTLPTVGESDNDAWGVRIFVDKRWLDAAGLQNPRTLDEYIAMLRAFKTIDPNGTGNVVPHATSFAYQDLTMYLLNALGYVTDDFTPWGGRAYGPAVRNGQAEVPAANPELFKEYITILKTLYDERLIPESFFTADQVEIDALIVEGRCGVYNAVPYPTGIEDWDQWESLYPLTSQWNSTPVWRSPQAISVGGFAISAKAKYPELAMRFANTFYGADGRMMWIGAPMDSEVAMGHAGVYLQEVNGQWGEAWNSDGWPEGTTDLWTYLMETQTPFIEFGAYDLLENINAFYKKWLGATTDAIKMFDLDNPDSHYRESISRNSTPYFSDSFPGVFYLDEATTLRLTDLETVLTPYIDEQVAMFVTGRRDMGDFDTFMGEIRGMGIDEINAIYQGVWRAYKGN